MSRKKTLTPKNIIGITLLMLLVAAALRDQLRLPPEERTWHGKIAGRIPYDLRPPTAERIRSTFWNKDTSEILVPQAFGIGWTLNLYPLFYPETVEKLPSGSQ
jgi:hypothetical protein